ncbi:hypothetical protein S101395_03900 [Bacillus sonorensis]|uniref:Uncharacterized protein n=1 Tax=Bacillus sonorensis TaxID=119858 RepID=A0ABN5ALH9_9BACI|nr:hypothetical protein S101395_03900 [Bacillus sonorensis]
MKKIIASVFFITASLGFDLASATGSETLLASRGAGS